MRFAAAAAMQEQFGLLCPSQIIAMIDNARIDFGAGLFAD
jgi:hypothetical protein